MSFDLNTPVGDLVLAHPLALQALEARGVDYCCGGKRSLREACEAAGQDANVVLVELQALGAPSAEAPSPKDWLKASLTELMDHIEATHHATLRAELPRLADLLQKVLRAHGENHPELQDVEGIFQALAADLMPHLMKEEQILFPFIRGLEAGQAGEACFHSVQGPIQVMEYDHDAVGSLLSELRAITRGYTVPADGCVTYQALYRGLEALEQDTHLHIYLENHLLHPRALSLEARTHA